ncbi:MAG TPA: putative Ig domain-containing protein, partial [Terracidiphilus sp.]|nr:putative Ig domain-containing protein [Terracidiphilus sp.]
MFDIQFRLLNFPPAGLLGAFRFQSRALHLPFGIGLLAAVCAVVGCGGGSSSNTTTPPPPSTLTITTSSLPNGQVGAAYSATLSATGGTAPYSWTLASGSLPAGLVLNPSSGAIAGTPSATANASALTFKVTDASSSVQTQTVNLTLTIVTAAPATLAITTTSLPNGQIGNAYSTFLAATGGTPAYTWSLTSGALPTGLSLNPATGEISGTPTAAASATALTFSVTDSGSPAQTQSVNLTLTIAASSTGSLSVTTASLPNGQVNAAYSATLTAIGGTTPYSWSLTAGTLPAGLTINAA